MKELEELKAAVKDLKFISEPNLFINQLEHKVEALEEVLIKRNLTSKCSEPKKPTPPRYDAVYVRGRKWLDSIF